jgi:replication factor C large subunit
MSMATARKEVLPFLSTMTHHCKNRELTVRMAAAYEMDAEHVAFVTGSGESTNKVQSIVEDARDLREAAAVEHSEGAFAGGEFDPEGPPGEVAEDEGDGQGEGSAAASNGGEAVDDETDDAADDQQSGLTDFY